ncbi:MAG: Protein translocase membrane subunit SecG, partial [uncultured Propionibacteriaceae bacterium]
VRADDDDPHPGVLHRAGDHQRGALRVRLDAQGSRWRAVRPLRWRYLLLDGWFLGGGAQPGSTYDHRRRGLAGVHHRARPALPPAGL